MTKTDIYETVDEFWAAQPTIIARQPKPAWPLILAVSGAACSLGLLMASFIYHFYIGAPTP